MREIFVNDGMTSILLGRKGENERTKITFDIADWIEEYPQATFALINQKPNTTTEYPVVISQPRDGKVSWVVGGNELLTEGYGQCTLEAVEGNVVAKRHIWRTRILTAMGEPGEFPEPWESWLTEFTRLKGEAEDAQEAAEEAAEDSEAWAVGQRGGVDVDDEDPTYENNAKYYAILAQTALDTAIAEAEAAAAAAETAQGKAEDAQEAAEDAQADAEAAQAAAELAKSTAESAASTATTAAGNAATSASAAASSASAAANAKTAAETAQSAAATSAATANTARAQTENLLAETITAKNAAVTAQDKAEDAQDAAEDAQAAAETAQTAAEAAQAGAIVAKGKAEDAQGAAETAQGKAEDAQEAAETAQGAAENAQEAAETAQEAAESAQSAAESAQEAAETAQAAAEEAAEEALETVESKAPAIYEEIENAAIASMNDGAENMLLKKLEVAIEPVQDLHGYDNPWPGGGNVNTLDPDSLASSASGAYSFSVARNGEWITLSGTYSGTESSVQFRFINKADLSVFPDNYRGYPDSSSSTYISGQIGKADNDKTLTIALRNLVQNTAYTIKFRIMGYTGSSAPAEYTPYSNVCPISGWTGCNVTRTGKNLINIDAVTLSAAGNWANNKQLDKPIPAGTYTFAVTTSAQSAWSVGFKDENGNTIGSGASLTNNPGRQSVVITLTGTATKIQGYLNAPATMSNFQFELGSIASEFTPYSGETIEYEFPQEAGTVYGGSLTIHQDGNGELVVDSELEVFNVADDNAIASQLNYFNKSSGTVHVVGDTVRISFAVDSSVDQTKYNRVSSTYTHKMCNLARHYFSYSDDSVHWYRNTVLYLFLPTALAGTTAQSAYDFLVSIKDTTPLSLWIPLATPVTYQLTNQQVLSLLKGNNVVFADCGDVSLEYPADTKLYIDGKIAEIQALILENISNS